MRQFFKNLILAVLALSGIAGLTLLRANDTYTLGSLAFLVTLLGLLYFSGTIPFGLLFSKMLIKQDIRTIGSGNIGATNVLRSGNKLAALLTLLFDFAKGLIPILLLGTFLAPFLASKNILLNRTFPLVTFPLADTALNGYFWTLTYLLPVLGHIFPFSLNFKGGKGVATGLGVIFAYSWPLGLALACLWGTIFWFTRLSSLSALLACLAAPALAFLTGTPSGFIWLSLLTGLIFWTHRDNIKRLLKGEEQRIGHVSKRPE
jgi:acyl-phosphate glycerol 3-phosphate acyltransferase